MILSPAADGLFQRAIVQSAPLGLRDGRDKMTAELGLVARRSLGDDPAGPDIDAVLQAQAAVVDAARRFGSLGGFPLAPVLGAAPLPTVEMVPARLAEAAQRVELFVGSTRDDGAPFVAVDPEHASWLGWGGLVEPWCAPSPSESRMLSFVSPLRSCQDLAWVRGEGNDVPLRLGTPSGTPLRSAALHGAAIPVRVAGLAGARRCSSTSADSRLAAELRRTWAAFAHHGLGTSVDGELVLA